MAHSVIIVIIIIRGLGFTKSLFSVLQFAQNANTSSTKEVTIYGSLDIFFLYPDFTSSICLLIVVCAKHQDYTKNPRREGASFTRRSFRSGFHRSHIHSSIHSARHSFTHWITHSLIHPLTDLFFRPSIQGPRWILRSLAQVIDLIFSA